MPKPRRSKMVAATASNKDLLSLFNGLTGLDKTPESLDLKIVYPKFCKLKGLSNKFVRTVNALLANDQIASENAGALETYVKKLHESHSEIFDASPDLAELHPPIGLDLLEGKTAHFEDVTPTEAKLFGEGYVQIKDSWVICAALNTTQKLREHKRCLGDEKKLTDTFITKTAGHSFMPIHQLPVNFKQTYISNALDGGDRRYMLVVFHKLLTLGLQIYETLTEPDIDVSQFVQVVLSSIDEIGKHVRGCEGAVNEIKRSVSMFKTNFRGYYRDFAVSGNSSSMIESFVMDVAKKVDTTDSSNKGGRSINGQFRKIITTYRKIAAQQQRTSGQADPRLNSVFAQLEKNFQHGDAKEPESEPESEPGQQAPEPGQQVLEPAPEPAPQLTAEERAAGRRRRKNKKRREVKQRQAAFQKVEAAIAN